MGIIPEKRSVRFIKYIITVSSHKFKSSGFVYLFSAELLYLSEIQVNEFRTKKQGLKMPEFVSFETTESRIRWLLQNFQLVKLTSIKSPEQVLHQDLYCCLSVFGDKEVEFLKLYLSRPITG